jgi:uncharacterized membrane protein YkoI
MWTLVRLRQALVAPLMLVAGIAAVGTTARAYSGEELAKNAKITIQEARTIALKAHHGKITDQELEKESGGSGLRYSFDIRVWPAAGSVDTRLS